MLSSCTRSFTNDTLKGTWVGNFKDKKVKLIFKKNNNCEIQLYTNHAENLIYEGIYEANFFKKPISLSITNIKNIQNPFHTIISFINEDSLKISIFSKKWRLRPINFHNDKTFFLSRVD